MLSFESEKKISSNIIGVDEVGRGPLAGPVVAAAVILNQNILLEGINDSKKITEKKREEFFLKLICFSKFSISFASVDEVDKYNILQASLMAMKRAVISLDSPESIILVDGIHSFDSNNKKIKTIVGGDAKYPSIAAASIIAKVVRDNYMKLISKKYNQYYWEKNFGYGTSQHLNSIKKFGITSFHRKTFSPIHKMLLKK